MLPLLRFPFARPETSPIPIIVLTGHDFKAYLKPAALSVGACSLLMKPCFPEQLAREVATRLPNQRAGAVMDRPARRASGAIE
jgi:CheY-like chemotaxis protein